MMEGLILRTLAILTYKDKTYKTLYDMIKDMVTDKLTMNQIRLLIFNMYDERETDYIMKTYWVEIESSKQVSKG